jgi:hypothetical protein
MGKQLGVAHITIVAPGFALPPSVPIRSFTAEDKLEPLQLSFLPALVLPMCTLHRNPSSGRYLSPSVEAISSSKE